MQHDNAMIQKLLDNFILPYIKKVAPTVAHVYVRSDGCKAQFKCANNFFWVSRQKVEGCGLTIHWSFFESCHDKCYCDPEGGTPRTRRAGTSSTSLTQRSRYPPPPSHAAPPTVIVPRRCTPPPSHTAPRGIVPHS